MCLARAGVHVIITILQNEIGSNGTNRRRTAFALQTSQIFEDR